MIDLPPLLTVPQLAELLDLTEHGVRALLRRGELPAGRLGRKWVVRREALLTHLKRGERRPFAVEERENEVDRLLRLLPRRRGR